MDYERQRFAKWFRLQREECLGTQEDAAALLGLSVETIYRIENGQYYWATIDREIKALIECRLYQSQGGTNKFICTNPAGFTLALV